MSAHVRPCPVCQTLMAQAAFRRRYYEKLGRFPSFDEMEKFKAKLPKSRKRAKVLTAAYQRVVDDFMDW